MPADLLNANTVLVSAGLLILFVNVIIGAARLRLKLGSVEVFNIALALAAVSLIVIGTARSSFSAPLISYGTAMTGGLFRLPDIDIGAAIPSSADMQLAVTIPPVIVAGLGLVVVVIAFAIYRYETHQSAFLPDRSAGLLSMGVGLLTMVAALMIPFISLEFRTASTSRIASAPVSPTSFAIPPVPTKTQTPPPRPTSTPRRTPTSLPSLTPTASETPIILYTVIPFTSTYIPAMANPCVITATTTLNLRGDPSVNQQAIGRVFAGSLLSVLARTSDKKWWRVINTDGSVNVEGWISGDFITEGTSCEDVPVTDGAGNSMASTVTPLPSTAAQANTFVTPVPCTLVTTAGANLRPDPSIARDPIAAFPKNTNLFPMARSADGGWWQVVYKDKIGWISAGAVSAGSTCAAFSAPSPPSP